MLVRADSMGDTARRADRVPSGVRGSDQPKVAAQRNPVLPVVLSGVFAVRAATRYRLQ